MNLTILHAEMSYSKEDKYVGKVDFQLDNHKQAYEMSLYSKDRKDWMYSLHFLNASGSEEEISKVEELIEQNDDFFDQLLEAAVNTLEQ
ncbi:hypothetical protein [Ferviditalea candida]|uniref:Uncharacterized protein n=1 Tax=Ferviditalea candida TaxID=3108399 RepID=A0ABU5ZGT5_9BACL|nr:hypothetical protein [Paenibacillaceae bacterium T2]